jgi:hypothetical protein
MGQTENPPVAAPVTWGSLDVEEKYVGWESSSPLSYPDNGSEFLTPLTLSVFPWNGGRIYAQSEYAVGSYTDSLNGTETISLNDLSDTVVGLETEFKSFSLPSLLNVGFNLPTGDSSWETQQSNSIVPTEFIDSDYRGRGFGMSLLYGLSFPAGKEQYGAAVGYLYSGAFNPYYGQSQQLKLGDSVFISLNHASDHGDGQSDVVRVSAFYFLPTQQDGTNLLQLGPNLNASYGWSNPKAFSFEAGTQCFLPAQQAVNGQLSGPSQELYGPRFYFNPSYVFGDFTLAGQAKYILSNGFSPGDNSGLYDGGGWLVGLEPSLLVKLDARSGLKFSAGYEYVFWQDGDNDSSGNRVNVEYGHWSFGTDYEVTL